MRFVSLNLLSGEEIELNRDAIISIKPTRERSWFRPAEYEVTTMNGESYSVAEEEVWKIKREDLPSSSLSTGRNFERFDTRNDKTLYSWQPNKSEEQDEDIPNLDRFKGLSGKKDWWKEEK